MKVTDYLIDPKLFYLANVAGKVNDALTLFCVALFIITAAFAVSVWCSYGSERDIIKKYFKKYLKIAVPLFLLFLCAALFIPDKETIIEMQIAKIATKENVSMTISSLKDAVDYVINSAKSIE